jgi:hypothetical protein
MEPNMKVTGEIIWLKVKEYSTMRMVTFTKENFIKTELMASECMFMPMDRDMRASGSKICKMVLAKRSLRMDQSTKVCLKMVRNGVKEPTFGLMHQFTPEIGLTIISRVKESISGQMVEFTKVNGKKINSMARDFTLGQMEEDTRVNIKTIKSMDMVLITGQMERSMKENGQTVNNMVKLDSRIQKARASLVSGKTVKERHG